MCNTFMSFAFCPFKPLALLGRVQQNLRQRQAKKLLEKHCTVDVANEWQAVDEPWRKTPSPPRSLYEFFDIWICQKKLGVCHQKVVRVFPSFESSATLDTLYEDQKIAKLRGILKGLQEENQSTQLLKVESEDMLEQTLGRNRGMSEQNVHKWNLSCQM